jgi:hypothetical protein
VTFQKLHKGIKPGIGKSKSDATFTDFSELKYLLNKLHKEIS